MTRPNSRRRRTEACLLRRFALGIVVFGTGIVCAFPVHAATVVTSQVAEISSSTPDNAYVFAGQARVDAPLPADYTAVAGTVTVAAPIARDALLAGGTIDIQKPIVGNARVVGGRVSVTDSVGGDLMVAGGVVSVSGQAKNTDILGGTIDMLNGSDGPVTIYGADVSLSGEYKGDVEVVASDKLTISEGTIIHGIFKYNAPQQADIPASAHIDGGINYIGAAAWLPTEQQAKTYAIAGLWIFIIVRIIAGLVATGLVAGLVLVFTDKIVEVTLRRTPERFILLALLGFAGFIAAPVLILFLIISFVGIGVAFILLASYLLFLLLAYVYANVLAGAALVYLLKRRSKKPVHITWKVAILGALLLYVFGSIPYIGMVIKVILAATAGGALLMLGYQFAFKKDRIDISAF